MKDYITTTIIRFLGELSLKHCRQLGKFLGLVLYRIGGQASKISFENIQSCYPHLTLPEQRRLLRHNLQETGQTLIETCRAWTQSPEVCLRDILPPQNENSIRELVSGGHGIIFVIPHIGNWEMINHYLGKTFPLTHMYQPNKRPVLNQFVQQARQNSGTTFVPATLSGVRAQRRTLDSGGNLGCMPDQEPEVHDGLFCAFFGQAALTGKLVPGLWQRSQATMIIASCLRTAEGFEVTLTPVTRPSEDSLQIAGQAMNLALESTVKLAPSQYLWSYKRFRTRPAGEAERYQPDLNTPGVAAGFTSLNLLNKTLAALPFSVLRSFGSFIGNIWAIFPTRSRRVARTNINLCLQHFTEQEKTWLLRHCLSNAIRRLFELPAIWQLDISRRQLFSVEGSNLLPTSTSDSSRGVLVLTPPLGQRELVFEYIGRQHTVLEYYHPHPRPVIDRLIRHHRTATGITLVDHTLTGESTARDYLVQGNVVALSPDQQPRLRNGIFAPFFQVPALSSTAIPRLVLASQARIVFGIAIPATRGFRLQFVPCELPSHLSDESELLEHINQALASLILKHTDQYRWFDKRFNIRPRGEAGLY